MSKSMLVLGLMSGTSLDGLDMALCHFSLSNEKWEYEFIKTQTSPYPVHLKNELKEAHHLSCEELAMLDIRLGKYYAKEVRSFLGDFSIKPQLISSHGQTIFHQPEKAFSLQIGSGAELATHSGLPVACDFRSTDIAKGGQGAPLVPIGDKLFFSEYSSCVNIGGFSNMSYEENTQRIAYDICPANYILNILAREKGYEYDKDGKIARSGNIDQNLLQNLNQLEYYNLKKPKSLGREWLENEFLPEIWESNAKNEDKLRTLTEHIAIQIANNLKGERTMITGGGAFNDFLIERINHHTSSEVILPDSELIDYKEALIFALLGTLRWWRQTNILKSYTGACSDSCSGALYLP